MLTAAYFFPISSVKTLWKKRDVSVIFFVFHHQGKSGEMFHLENMANKFVFKFGCQNSFGEKDGDLSLIFPSVSPKFSCIIFQVNGNITILCRRKRRCLHCFWKIIVISPSFEWGLFDFLENHWGLPIFTGKRNGDCANFP